VNARTLAGALAVALAIVLLAPEAPALAQTPDAGEIRPEIVWKKIPFGAKRKRQMAAYSGRHYGGR